MDENDGVRTRLTHSHEVANLARSIGTRAYAQAPLSFEGADLHNDVQPLLAATGLAHDLGNPPFGHQGERAIGRWFEKRASWIFTHKKKGSKSMVSSPISARLVDEFLKFDGNPQTLRLLTRLQTHQARVGLDLSAATLAASLKYAVCANNRDKTNAAAKKAGYYESEREIVEWIWSKTGLKEGQRHPLTWIMEACDDIAYSVLDVDDLLKKEVISPDDVLVVLRHDSKVSSRHDVIKLEAKFKEVNETPRRAEIRRDIKIQYVRAYMIEALINDASAAFVANDHAIHQLNHKIALMEGNPLCDALKGVAKQYGFSHPSVLKAEAEGAAAVEGLMSALWEAISDRANDDFRSDRGTARSRYLFSLISPNYIEEAEDSASRSGDSQGLRYRELRLLTDMVSGMTDTFATKLWRDICIAPNANRA